MPATYQVRIRGRAGAASETAAVRLVAGLPTHWSVTLLNCTDAVAALEMAPPENASPGEVARVVDEVLATSAMRGWTRDGPVT